MSDAKLYPPEVMAPVQIAMIGTGDGGMQTGTAVTSSSMPNIAVTVITPFLAILIRFANVYLTILVGLLAAGMTTTAIPASDFWHLLLTCMGLALPGAGVGAIKDCLTVFGKLETKFPLLTGNV